MAPIMAPISNGCLRLPRCVSTGPVVVRLAERANERERERERERFQWPVGCCIALRPLFPNRLVTGVLLYSVTLV